MPTLRNATTRNGCFIRWKPHPDHGRPSTYQITNRGLRFLESLGYAVPQEGDEVEIPREICRPLRILGDLHFENEESPGNVEIDQTPSIPSSSDVHLSPEEEAKLRKYIETHPRLTDEKETELSEDLGRLESDSDVQLETGLQPGPDSHGGPAAQVNVDIEDYFGDGKRLPSEIAEIVEANEPPNVGDDVPEPVEEAMGQIDRTEYHTLLTEVPGYRRSLREFDAHPRELNTIAPDGETIRYSLDSIEHPQSGMWLFWVMDGRRAGEGTPDLQFSFKIIDKEGTMYIHDVQIDNGQFVRWSVSYLSSGSEEFDITEMVTDTEEVSGEEFHAILHDRSVLLEEIEKFVNDLENASIQTPAEWNELDE